MVTSLQFHILPYKSLKHFCRSIVENWMWKIIYYSFTLHIFVMILEYFSTFDTHSKNSFLFHIHEFFHILQKCKTLKRKHYGKLEVWKTFHLHIPVIIFDILVHSIFMHNKCLPILFHILQNCTTLLQKYCGKIEYIYFLIKLELYIYYENVVNL